MSRIRTIKPTFWTSEQIVECSLSTRLLFIGLWNFCDKSGRHSFSPKQIKGQVFPSDDISTDSITEMLWELSDNGLIVVYDNEKLNGNNRLLQVTGWKHQKIDNEQSSKIPGPEDEGSAIIRRNVSDKSESGRGSIIDDSPKDLGLRTKDLGKEKKTIKKESFDSIEKHFLDFWDKNPNKVGKAAARKSFASALKRTTLPELMAGLDRYIRDRPHDRPWCNPATWLNQDRWLDQPARAGPPPNGRADGKSRPEPPTAPPGETPEQARARWLKFCEENP